MHLIVILFNLLFLCPVGLFSSGSRWAYKGVMLSDEDGLETQWQEKGRSVGIAPFLNESLKRWKTLTIVAACMPP
jgi:hypothetical protein